MAILGVMSGRPAAAQVLYGSIVGNVTDQSQAAVSGATVTIIQEVTNLTRDTTTSETGAYTFSTVPTGTYTVRVSHASFKQSLLQGIVVSLNNIARVNFALSVGDVKESVEVTSRAPSLQTDKADVRSELTTKSLIDLPTTNRNFQYLYTTIPGFSNPVNSDALDTSPSRALFYNVNGTSASTVNTRIDGTSSTEVWLPDAVAYIPTLEAIETVNIVTNSFDAEQGLAGGAAVNVQLKSGTNQLHGSAFEFHNDNALNAKPVLLPATQNKPKSIDNTFGGSFGGPIKKEKLFYFTSIEQQRLRRTGTAFATVPTPGMRIGDMSASTTPIYNPFSGNADGSGRVPFQDTRVPDSMIEPIVKKIIDLVPLPNRTGTTNNYFASDPLNFDRLKWDTKINWNASQKMNMYGRFSILRFDMLNTEEFGPLGGNPIARNPQGDPGTGFGGDKAVSIGGSYIVSPSFVIDGNFGWNHQDTNVQQGRLNEQLGLNYLGIPGTNGPRNFEGGWPRFLVGWTGIQASDFTPYGTCCPFMPAFQHDPQYQYVANASWLKQNHNIRFGAEYYIQGLDHTQAEIPGVAFHGAQGGFGFTGGTTALKGGPAPNLYNEYSSFLLGLSSFTGKINLVNAPIVLRTQMWSAYIRDQWQVTPKLTVNYGTRWEYFPIPMRDTRGIETYDFATNLVHVCGVGSIPSDCGISMSKSEFAPLVGIAYRATSTFVIRAGFGLTFDPFNLAKNLRGNYPVEVALNLQAPNSFSYATELKNGIPAIPNPVLGNGIIPIASDVPFSTLTKDFTRGYIMSWNFTLQKELLWGFTGQAGYVATRSIKQLGFVDQNVGIPGGGVASEPLFAQYGRTAISRILQGIGNNHYDSLQTTLSRRLSHGLTMNLAYTWSKVISLCCDPNSTGSLGIQAPGYLRLNRSVASINEPNVFALTGIAELPFGKGKQYLNRGGLVSALAGGWQANGIFTVLSGLPFTVTSSATACNCPSNTVRANQIKPNVAILGGTGPGQAYFDPTAFAPLTTPGFGTAGFLSLKGPTAKNLDFSLFRKFQMTERFAMEFRAEAFNLTNTPHWGNPSGLNVSNMSLNPDGSIKDLGGFGVITTTRPNGRESVDERNLRLGLRFSF
jgi:hypothetical protein